MFDKNWENNIYKKSKQFNNYPYDWVVSNVNKFIKSKKNCLEVGSGTGNNIEFFRNFGFKNIISIEGSKTAYKYQKKKFKRLKNISIHCQDFNKFNYQKHYDNLVLDRGSITHNKIDDMRSTINKIYDSLCDEGYFFSIIFSSKSSFNNKKKDQRAFAKQTNTKKGLITNFLSYGQILKFFSKFKIVSLVHEKREILLPNKQLLCNWNVICQKKL